MTSSGLSIRTLDYVIREVPEGLVLSAGLSARKMVALAGDFALLLGAGPLGQEASEKIASDCATAEGRKKSALFALALATVAKAECRRHFAASAEALADALSLIRERCGELAALHDARYFIGDASGREEFARTLMRAFALLPEGETAIQAEDRFTAVDSVERRRVIRKAKEAQKRTQEIRLAIEAREAEEAASKMSRE